MNYEVTIGIPAYKAVDYIGKTMESALNQTFNSIEYLIVDDCGNDGTINIVERFQKEHQRGKDIRILYNKQNNRCFFLRRRSLSGKHHRRKNRAFWVGRGVHGMNVRKDCGAGLQGEPQSGRGELCILPGPET